MERFILALDQGTTSSRAILFDRNAKICGIAQREFTQYYPESGWVEHHAEEIWSSQIEVAREVLRVNGVSPNAIEAIGITNQRETTVVWDRQTGHPIHPAIVWQDRRTASICDQIKASGHADFIRERTGLVVDAYFSGTKIRWILDHVAGARQRAESGELLFGTVDSWLIWNLTGGSVHATDASNASRTMLFDLHTGAWSEKLCQILDIPMAMLPEIKDSSGSFGYTIPSLFDGTSLLIGGVAGDQQAALFGQGCLHPGQAKNTYGTGCFLLMQTGSSLVHSHSGLITTVAWKIDGKLSYALEGSVFVAGAAIQWLRDGLGLLEQASDSEELAGEVDHSAGVYVVPAFTGLGAPYWDMYARGAIFGLTRGTTKHHLIRATLESLAFQSRDVLDAMSEDAGQPLVELRVDGGAAANNVLMQFQSDVLGIPVQRPIVLESTALGAAYLAGLASGFYKWDVIERTSTIEKSFTPNMTEKERQDCYQGWKEAVRRTGGWLRSDQPTSI